MKDNIGIRDMILESLETDKWKEINRIWCEVNDRIYGNGKWEIEFDIIAYWCGYLHGNDKIHGCYHDKAGLMFKNRNEA